MSEITICVLSDFHCHLKDLRDKNGKIIQDSHLLVDVKLAESLDPAKSFINLIEQKSLQADYLLIPGDITNRACKLSFEYGWERIQEINKILGCKELILTLGNHDIDTEKLFSSNPLDLAKSIGLHFPFISADFVENIFWELGFGIAINDECLFLVINTAFDIEKNDQSVHGSIYQYQLDEIKKALSQFDREFKFKIAILHHHPIPHDRCMLGSYDIVSNSQLFLNLLENNEFSIVIHGHKHDPLIRYSNAGGRSIPIFAAGSFAAFKTRMPQSAMNTSHFLTLSDDHVPNCVPHGIIRSYFFVPHFGWHEVDNFYLPHHTGFGCIAPIRDMMLEIDQWITTNNCDDIFMWDDLTRDIPYLPFLTPESLDSLLKMCAENKIYFTPYLPKLPQHGSRV